MALFAAGAVAPAVCGQGIPSRRFGFYHVCPVIAADPLHPFRGTYVYMGKRITLLDEPNPLLWPYLIAGVRMVFGESEVAVTLLNLPFAAALWGMQSLAWRLGRFAATGKRPAGNSPAFVVMATDVMPDIAFVGLARWLLALGVRAVTRTAWPPASPQGSWRGPPS